MAIGWAGDGAVQDQIDATVKDAIKRARSQLPQGPGRSHCEECDAPIPEARRKAMPGVRRAYDLHAWTLTSGFDAMSGHVVVDDVAAGPGVIRAIRALLKERHGIEHVTVQVEDEALAAEAAHLPV